MKEFCRNGHRRRDYGYRKLRRYGDRQYLAWRCRRCARPNARANSDPRSRQFPPIPGFDPQTLREDRLDVGLLPSSLAFLLGVSASTVRGWERGRSAPNTVAWRRLQALLERLWGLCPDWRPRRDYSPEELAALRAEEFGEAPLTHPTTIPYLIHLPDGRTLRRFATVEDDGSLMLRVPPEYWNYTVSVSEERVQHVQAAQEESQP